MKRFVILVGLMFIAGILSSCNDKTVNPGPNNIAEGFQITSPKENPYHTKEGVVRIEGVVPKGAVKSIEVNGYNLSKFKPFGTNWFYFANNDGNIGTMKSGENIYKINYYGTGGDVIFTHNLVIIDESSSADLSNEPQGLIGSGNGSQRIPEPYPVVTKNLHKNISKFEQLTLSGAIASDQKARDLTRLKDLSNIQIGIEQYFGDNNQYPQDIDTALHIYLPVIPKDPMDGLLAEGCKFGYEYKTLPNQNGVKDQGYLLSACLENPENIEKKAKNDGWSDPLRYELMK